MKIDQSLAVITGASQGIGAATAKLLAKKGAQVVLMARTVEKLDKLAEEIEEAGGKAWVYPIDLGDHEKAREVIEKVIEERGVPHIVIHSAGAGRWLSVEETDPEEAVQMMAVPYFATFFATRFFLPAMLKEGRGHFVVVNSPAGRVAVPGAAGYVAARSAMMGFTEALRADLRGTGLGVTSVIPGKVDSSYFANNAGAEDRVPGISRLFRTLSPEEVASAIEKGIRREKREVWMPFLMKVTVFFHRLFPRLVEWSVVSSGWKRG